MADPDIIDFPDQPQSAVALGGPISSQPEDINFPDKTPQLEKNFWDTYSADPDRAAKVLKLAQKYNQPEMFIDKNLPDAEKADQAPPTDYWANLEKNYPGTTQFLLDPKNMAVAKDDSHNLASLEGLVNEVKTAWNTETNALKSGSLQETRDLLNAQKVFGYGNDSSTLSGYLFNRLRGVGAGMTPDERIAGINAQLADLDKQKPKSLVGRGIYGATEFLPWIAGGLAKGAEYSLVLGGASALAGIETGPGAAVTGTAGATVGLGIGEAEYNYMRMTGAARSQFEQIRDKDGNPLPENTINIASAAAGVATSALGLIKVNSIISRIPGGGEFLQKFQSSLGDQVLKPASYKAALARFAKTWATGTAEATAAGTGIAAINIGTGAIAKAASGQPFDYSPKDAVKELASTAGETALTFGTLGLPGPMAGLGMDTAQVRRAEQTRQVYQALGTLEKDSKLRTRLPEARQAFVDAVTKDSPVENIYTPVEQFDRYFQDQKIDPAKVASELGISDQLEQARQTGADVQIPLSAWTSKIVGTPHEQGLMDDSKFHPEDLTPRQARDRSLEIANQLQSTADSAVKENPTLQKGRDAVFQDVHDQLVSAGRPEKEAVAGATVWASRAIIEAHRRGMTPEAWYEGAHLRVTDDPNAQPRADAPAAPDHPEGFDPELMHRMVYDAAAQEGYPADQKEVSRLLLRYGQDPRYVAAALHSGEEVADKFYYDGKLPTMAESVEQPAIPETKFRHSKKEVEARATALRDQAVQEHAAGQESDLVKRINGKIKWTKDLQDLGDLGGKIVPIWLRKQIFTKEGTAPSLDAKAQELGMSSADLIKQIVDYPKTRKEVPSSKVEHYLEQARQEIENEKRQGQISAAKAAAEERALPSRIARFMERLGVAINPQDPNVLRQDRIGTDLFGQPYKEGARPKFVPDEQRSLFDQQARPQFETSQHSLTPQTGLPVVAAEAKTGPPHAVFSYNWKISKDAEPVPYFRLYGDPELINKQTRIPGNETGNTWRSDVSEDTVKAAGIPIIGKSPKATEEPFSKGAIQGRLDQSPIGQDLPGQRDTSGASEEHQRTVFPGPKDSSSPSSITANPSYIKMREQATAIADRYAKQRGTEATPEFVKEIWGELHDELGRIRLAPAADRLAIAKEVMAKYPTIENDFMVLKDQLWADKTDGYFEKFIGDRYAPDQSAKAEKLFQDIQDPRGFIQFTPRETLVALVNADASTFMHESAHYWLKDLFDYVKVGGPNEKTLADWKILADWMGIKDDQKELTRAQQEQFARGFESYLREGKSPSETLRKAFSLFRRWLTRLYRDPAMLNVHISDDVRGVMDRMLASEDEIAFAEQQAGHTADLLKEFEGVAPELHAKMLELGDQAHEQAVMDLMKRQMRELSADHKMMLAEESRKATEAAKKAVEELPEQQAVDAIRRSSLKIKDGRKAAASFLDTENPMSAKDKESFEALATMNGYMSGDEMAKKILTSKTAAEEIKLRVAAHMSQFADLRNTDAIKEEAIRAIHNDKRSELMALERIALQSLVSDAQGRASENKARAAEAKLEAEVARSKAKEIIAGKSVRDAGSFMPFFTAERNAAANVAKAMAAKDYAKAAEYKRQQMLNHELVREAYAAKAKIDKAMRTFQKLAARGRDLKDMPYGFVRQIDKMLSDHGLADPRNEDVPTFLKIAQDMASKGYDDAGIANATGLVRNEQGQWVPETLSQAVARAQDNYYLPEVADSVLSGQQTHYNAMKFGDFMDLHSAVKSMNTVGRAFERFLSESIKSDVKAAAAEAAASIREKIGAPYAEQRTIGRQKNAFMEKLDAWTTQPGDVFLDLVGLNTLCRYLDGGKEDGPMQNYIYRLLSNGENKKIRLNETAVEAVRKVYEDHFTPEDFKHLQDRVHFDWLPENKNYLTREEMVSMALNYGNEGNRQRLRDGFQITDDQIMQAINSLSKKEMDFVQATWDHLNTYWPQIVELEMKASGVEPKKVANAEVHTIHGVYEGGYYPLAYDNAKSADAYANAEQRNALYKVGSSVAGHTDTGHTKARVAFLGRPLRLSMNVFNEHVANVVHDLSYREAVIDANRLLRQRELREAIQNAIGGKGLRTIESAIRSVASDQGEPLDTLQKAVKNVRMGATVSHMAYRLFNFPYYAAGNFVNAMWQVGPERATRAMIDYAMNPGDINKFVLDSSDRMRSRATLIDRDLGDLARRWAGDQNAFHQFAFTIMKHADEVVTIPVWNEVYNRNVLEHGKEKAAHMADEAVTNIAGSGSILDRAEVQRGSEYKKVLTWMYSWLGMMFNHTWLDGKLAGLEYDKGNKLAAASIMAKTAFYGWFLSAAVNVASREFFRNPAQGEDQDKKKKRIIKGFLTEIPDRIPGVGLMADYTIGTALGERSDVTLPFQSTIKKLADPFADVGAHMVSGKNMDQFPEHVANAASAVTGYPQQFNTWAFNFLDDLRHNGELNWRDAVMRKTKN